MSLTIFPSLPDKTLVAVNTVGAWLAEDNLPYNPPALQPDLDRPFHHLLIRRHRAASAL